MKLLTLCFVFIETIVFMVKAHINIIYFFTVGEMSPPPENNGEMAIG
jgi:hypothetical protein